MPPAGSEKPRSVRGVAVRAPASAFVLPEVCACCGAPPARRVREGHVSGRVAFVPYCTECHAHVSREQTRLFATSLSAVIVALTFGFGLPLVWQPRLSLVYAACVLAAGLTPIALGALWPRMRSIGHVSIGRAAAFRVDGTFACARPDWGALVARENRAQSFEIRFREGRIPVSTVAVLVAASALLPVYYRAHFPSVRIVNLTDTRLEIVVDGRVRANVPPTSAESTGAGVELRVAAGQRLFSAIDETGRVVDTAEAAVRSGVQHLYAPASGTYCFWVETTGYGRNKGNGTEVRPLRGPGRFWALEDAIDLWFSPLPDADFDDRSTGGYLRAVRQAPCEAAPGSTARENGATAPFATGVE
jgi:hypothetical protein